MDEPRESLLAKLRTDKLSHFTSLASFGRPARLPRSQPSIATTPVLIVLRTGGEACVDRSPVRVFSGFASCHVVWGK